MKLQNIFKVLFVVAAVLLIAEGRKRRDHRKKRLRSLSNSTDFDLLIFTQRWPQTVCYTWKETEAQHTCLLPGAEEWSIHGIWPTQMGKVGPEYCKKIPFNPEQLAQIEDELKLKWIDVENGTAHYSFWKHEWEKHGTCASVLDDLSTEFKYFQKGLTLWDTYDMKHVLAKANILPGQGYLVQTILDGVAKVLGKRCQVECVNNPKTQDRYLFEVRICFDKRFNLIDCDGISNYPTNCKRKKMVIYPGTVPNLFSVIQM